MGWGGVCGSLGYIFHLPFGSWLTVLRFMFCVCPQNSIAKKTFFLCWFLWQSSPCTLSKTFMMSCSVWRAGSVLFPAHVPLPGSSLADMSKHICLPVVWLWWHGCLLEEMRSLKSRLPQWHAMLAGCDPESYRSSFGWMEGEVCNGAITRSVVINVWRAFDVFVSRNSTHHDYVGLKRHIDYRLSSLNC